MSDSTTLNRGYSWLHGTYKIHIERRHSRWELEDDQRTIFAFADSKRELFAAALHACALELDRHAHKATILQTLIESGSITDNATQAYESVQCANVAPMALEIVNGFAVASVLLGLMEACKAGAFDDEPRSPRKDETAGPEVRA